MRTIVTMLRLPNLLIIAITFYMLRYLVFIPVYTTYSLLPGLGRVDYMMMVIATLMIAAAGYLSNDYFDIVADRINKPHKLFVGTRVAPGAALASSLLLSLFSVLIAIWISWHLKSWIPAILLLTALGVTWWYAIKLKRSFAWGNLAVACMSAGTIGMAWLTEYQAAFVPTEPGRIITGIVTAISIFALLLSLMREIVKDMEDVEGDRLIGCKSMPIVKGMAFTKNVLLLIGLITLGMLVVAQVYLFQFNKIIAAVWLFISVEIPLVGFASTLKKSESKQDFHRMSTLLKWIMVGGIASMVAGQF
jgi:4-hydroxybenzoate polyprenyltransferase